MLPRTFEEIARQETDFQRRIESLEHQRSGSNRLIDSAILTAPVASVVFSNIPNIYDHLLLLPYSRTDFAGTNDTIVLRFNGDAGNNYDTLFALISTAGLVPFGLIATSIIFVNNIEGATAPANSFSTGYARINHYANAANHKSVIGGSSLKTVNLLAGLTIALTEGHWRNPAPITSITLLSGQGANFVAGSRFDLYGIQGG